MSSIYGITVEAATEIINKLSYEMDSMCQSFEEPEKAQDIADNTLFVHTLNILTPTNNHIAPGDA